MSCRFAIGFFLAIIATQAVGQMPPPAPKVFTNVAMGFRYNPPSDMRDLTKNEQMVIQQHAAQTGAKNTMTLLLALQSGPDDTATDWHSVGIQAYPREKVRGSTERSAEATFSQWVAGRGAGETEPPTESGIGGAHFVVSTFQLHEGRLTKYATVYTTVRDGQMLSFAFSANSRSVLDKITDSMKTFSLTSAR